MPTRPPTHSAEAEKAVIGAILREPHAIDLVAQTLKPDDFYVPAHITVYKAVETLYRKQQPIDSVTVHEELKRTGDLERVGGALVISDIVDSVPSAANVEYYAKIVSDHSDRRAMIRAAADIIEAANTADVPVEDFLHDAERRFLSVTDQRLGAGFQPLADQINPMLAHIEKIESGAVPAGLTTGLIDLDKTLSGLQQGNLVIIAGRTSTDKSALATGIAAHVSQHHGPVALFSLEMSRRQITQRLLSAQARINSQKLESGQVGPHWPDLAAAAADLYNRPLYVDDTSGTSITEIRAKTRRLQRREGLKLVIVDYLQLMRGRSNPETRQTEIAEISRSLKALALELDVPVIALSQLNRQLETRTDKRPQLSDLRESGAIEQDADVVILIHKSDHQPDDQRGIVQLIVAKHRTGPTGTVKVAFLENYAAFANLTTAARS